MSETIGFRQTTECLGRNGVMKMAGIHVSRQGDALYIAPVTSRMRIGRAWMLVPVEAVPDVVTAMQRVGCSSGRLGPVAKAA
jgi:hypothetical protein